MSALLELDGVSRHFPQPRRGFGRRPVLRAVQDVSLQVAPGEVVGLVGESGSGKSTLGRVALGLLPATAGRVRFAGQDLAALRPRELRALRRQMQMVFQDPFASLNRSRSIGGAIAEVLKLHGLPHGTTEVAAALQRVGLEASDATRRPRQFSGGQRQRIAIARALAVQPRFLVADEPVSALDVSVQAGILRLLQEQRGALGLAMLFISHDLTVVEAMADRVLVLYLGRVMEAGPAAAIFAAPRHPYTAALLAAAPGSFRAKLDLQGEIPSPAAPPSGCVFRTRCPFAVAECTRVVPVLRNVEQRHAKACIRDDLAL
ncbi:ABC transporter ATP-binding protein [Siccirubricoccus sp. KC 17139]|uniref:ABC transporter ATP-binding protein n=1 Tax=Siccirubricoccus soli TaxID=2899147 RepID=A0ABT1D1I8_9PROT|nr:ABC transporter ATP-binding protein [Siccirubricoccus soli]MCO6415779.1 ABC transporter ATP-binding protein [Siccirubricoccus soli]MCP2681911.1 ABC transporter ATP-binding protein [Siccirubricoccus soli]